MNYKRVFKELYVEELKDRIKENPSLVNLYEMDQFEYKENQVLESKKETISYPKLIVPDSKKNHFDFENSKNIFESMKHFSPAEASDPRFWAYLSHTLYWDYVKARSRVEEEKRNSDFIISHWFIDRLNVRNLLRQDLSKLWWVSYMTFDPQRKDPYELTREAFSMLDYIRFLLEESLGSYRVLTHALLEYIINNPNLFQKNKQDRARYLMTRCNLLAGFKILGVLSKSELKELFDKYKKDIELI